MFEGRFGDMISMKQCEDICLESAFQFHYEFVWFFIIAFLMDSLKFPLMRILQKIKFDEGGYVFRDHAHNIASGMGIASYILYCAGLLWYLFAIGL